MSSCECGCCQSPVGIATTCQHPILSTHWLAVMTSLSTDSSLKVSEYVLNYERNYARELAY